MWRGVVLTGIVGLAACGRSYSADPAPAGDPAGGGGGAANEGGGGAGGEGSSSAGLSPKTCSVNCCDGTVVPLSGDHFEADACKLSAKSETACDEHGGTANVFFDDGIVSQDLACDGSCAVNCCDGTAFFEEHEDVTECQLAAAAACAEPTGGPSTVAYDDVLTWTASGKCPSLKPCLLTCNDGTQSMSQQYLAMVCEALTLESVFCKKHGGVHTVYFDSEEVWPAPQP